ncbi:MAG: fibronectin type III domain-containing protein [bacterium]|nr:fibronectin type III domain-containing protein [bacterium]
MNRKKQISRLTKAFAVIMMAIQLAFTGAVPASASTVCAVTTEWEQFQWDCYSNDYYYSKLSEEEQELYEKLDAVCGQLLESNKDANVYSVKGVTRYGTPMVDTTDLSKTQIEKVQTAFLYSNPQYYFLNTIRYTTKNKCALGIYEAFVSGSVRTKANARVEKQLKQLQKQVMESEYLYETEKSIHDVLRNNIRYGDDTLITKDSSDKKFYQTIYGGLINKETVCAGYTKLYVALCNYFHIDCIAINSKSHAWNMVRYGENWYHVDVTWDENTDSEMFFHLTTGQLLSKDQKQSHVAHGFWSGLAPEADVTFDESLQTWKGLKMPEVTVTYTASGLTINMSATEGDVYYSLDGTHPTEDDIYTHPVVLNDAGTYRLTAVAKKDGYADSCFLIIPVRIAPGTASITKAVNASGNKIRVQYRSSEACDGYEISYASKKDFRNQKTAKVTGKTVTIKKLKKNTAYYVRVRAYRKDVNGKLYYTSYSKVKKVVVTK